MATPMNPIRILDETGTAAERWNRQGQILEMGLWCYRCSQYVDLNHREYIQHLAQHTGIKRQAGCKPRH